MRGARERGLTGRQTPLVAAEFPKSFGLRDVKKPNKVPESELSDTLRVVLTVRQRRCDLVELREKSDY